MQHRYDAMEEILRSLLDPNGVMRLRPLTGWLIARLGAYARMSKDRRHFLGGVAERSNAAVLKIDSDDALDCTGRHWFRNVGVHVHKRKSRRADVGIKIAVNRELGKGLGMNAEMLFDVLGQLPIENGAPSLL